MSAGGRRPGRPSKASLGFLERGPIQRSASSFGRTLYDYLERLGWNQADLVNRTGITKSQISGWISKGDRAIGRDDVCRIVWAIAGGLDGVLGDMSESQGQAKESKEEKNESGGTLEGRAFLDQLLNKFLQSAGYAPETSVSSVDQIWRLRFSPSEEFSDIEKFDDIDGDAREDWKPELKVGWVHWPAFAEEDERGYYGYAEEITQQICRYLGARKPRFIPLDPEQVPEAIQSRKVDFVAPVLVQLPRRLAYLRFSKPIPRISVGIKTVTHRGCEGRHKSSYRPNVIKGEVGETMAGVIFPDEKLRPARFKTLQEAVEKLDEEAIDPYTDRMRCLVIDDITYCGLKSEPRYEAYAITDANIPDTDYILEDRFPIGLAVHSEEPSLLNAINMCISILERNHFFDRLYAKMTKAHPLLAETLGVTTGYDLQLMPSINKVSDVQRDGKNLVLVATVGQVLHFRIFDHNGNKVVDIDERKLTAKAKELEDLKERLNGLWPPHELAKSEKDQILDDIISIFGHTFTTVPDGTTEGVIPGVAPSKNSLGAGRRTSKGDRRS